MLQELHSMKWPDAVKQVSSVTIEDCRMFATMKRNALKCLWFDAIHCGSRH